MLSTKRAAYDIDFSAPTQHSVILQRASPLANVLIMEDDPDQAFLLGTILSDAEHDPTVTFSGGEAWATLVSKPFDLLLTDMRVYSAPHVKRSDGGLALIIRIRNATGSDMPDWVHKTRIIAISGMPMENQPALELAHTFGANMCLEKPVDSAELLNAIKTVMESPPGTVFPQSKKDS